MSWKKSMGYADYLLFTSHTFTGPGLFALLSFSRISNEGSVYAVGIIAACFALGMLLAVKYPPYTLESRSLFFHLVNISFCLVVTIAVLLNVAGQIYPERGRELALIPTYVLLCSSRLCPSEISYTVHGTATLLCLVLTVLLSQSERHARPESTGSFEWLTLLDLVLANFYAATQAFSGVFYSAKDWERPKWLWDMDPNGKWVLNTQWEARLGAGVSQAIFFSVIFLSRDAAVYHFLVPKASPVFPSALVLYGSLLLFGSMLLASSWFACLRDVMGSLGRTAPSGHKVVRLQHVLYVLVIAGAYIYPLQMVELRVILVGMLLLINAL